MKKKAATPPVTKLRSKAELNLSGQKKKTAATPATKVNIQRLVHELQVHQIELEMQNEELVQSRAELESTLNLYAELYAFAPVGYFTLTRDGTIRRANLTGAKLLGVGLSDLIMRRFAGFIAPQSRATFSAFLDKVFISDNKEACEIMIQLSGPIPLWAHIEAVVDSPGEQGQLCYTIVSDITERKLAEEALGESEELYRSLFENMPNGFAYCEMSFDVNNRPSDFTYLAVNSAFESLTGLRKVAGRKASEVIPEIRESDPELLEIYGRVSKTGKSERFQMFINSLRKRFWISAYCPWPGYFVVLFVDISEPGLSEEVRANEG
jgi:PAS domain-containing protein